VPKKKLTNLFVERVKAPASGRTQYFDAAFPGLAPRVTHNGAKSFAVSDRTNGRLRGRTIGNYPALKPAAAWREAQAARERVPADADPANEKKVSCGRRAPETEWLPDIGEAGLVRTMTGDAPVSGFSRAKRCLDEAAFAAERSECAKHKDDAVHPCTVHDLRRTAASGMAHLKIPPHVVERILNPTSSTIRGVAAVHNRFACIEGCAREAWGRYVDNLVAEALANIIDLKTAR
jgi:hypothetical protein